MSYRLEKINKLLRREINQIFLREIDFADGVLITVTEVRTTADLRVARIMVSVLPFDKSQFILAGLNKRIFEWQQILNRKLKMRPVPKIVFVIDESAEKVSRIESVLGKVKESGEFDKEAEN